MNSTHSCVARSLNAAAVGLRALAAAVVILWGASVRAQSAEPLGETVGVPWTGEPGITETVDQIMARDALTPPETEVRETKPYLWVDRSNLPLDPNSPQAPGLPVGSGYGQRSPQPVALSFLGATLGESGFIPPDTLGEVSPTQVLVFLNGRIKVFNKSGALGALNTTTDTFFNSVRNSSGTSDPRVIWDRISQRWFLVMINTSTPNRVLIAVSSGATITGTSSFTFFQFQQDLPTPTNPSDTGGLADYPSLGVDANALYVGVNMFNPGFNGTTGWVIRKSDLLVGTLTVTAFRQMATASGVGPYSPRGVTNDDPASTQGYFLGSNNAAFGSLVMRRISTPGGTPTISANITITVNSTANPINVPAEGSGTAVEASDDRVYDARIHKNRLTGAQTLWCAHTIQVNSSGVASSTGGRDAARWYQLQNLTTTPSVVQQGTLFDSAASNPRFFFYASVAMSGQGHMALGCTAAGATEFLECVVAGRYSGDALNTIQSPTTAQSSSTAYTVVASGRNRWGDYSSTEVDPSDDMTMWSFQEYCDAANDWAVRVLKLSAPPPAAPASCSPTSVNQGDTAVNVVLTGTSASSSGFFDPDSSFPNHIGAAVNGGGVTVNTVTFTDPTHVTLNVTVSASATVGARTITVTNPDGQNATSASGILTINAGTPVCPAVTQDPSSLTRCTTTSASFTVAGTGTPAPTFQWRHNTVNISGATSTTYTIASVGTGDAGNYDCVLTNTCGSATSNAAMLTVNTPPTVTTQPSPQSACVNGSVTFTTAGGGSPAPTFQWRKGGVNIAGQTGASLTINPVGTGDAGNYDCLLTNSCGNVPTNSVALTVNTAPTFSTQPNSQTVCLGSPFSFSVAASGSPAPTFQWRHDGTPIGGATSSTYSATVTSTSGGTYDCVATNTCAGVPSNPATLTVGDVPSINGQPSPQTVCAGQPFSFTVAASGTPAPAYQWRRNNVDIPGATSPTFGGTASAATQGTYSCLVSNSCGGVPSSNADLTVNTAPGIDSNPSNAEACVGSPASFTVSASGSPAPTYQWRKGGSNIAGATGATYTIASVGGGDAGSYDCVATNSCGSATSTGATLTVDTAPSVTTHPSPQSACAGGSVTFTAAGSGSPAPSFQWRKGGSNIPGQTSPSLTINPVTAGDAGSYDCVLTNSCGSATTNPAGLTVNTGPAVTSDPSNAEACEGSQASFTVGASGSPAPTYQWRKGGSNIAGAMDATYTIPSVSSGDAGSYDCVVTNSCGSAASNAATLTVDTSPQVVDQPADQAACAGGSATFMVSGSGTPAPTYQWRHGGSPIAGATAATLHLTNVGPADGGAYDCVLSNVCGSSPSSPAALNVGIGPSINTQPSPQTVTDGDAAMFSVDASGDAPLAYQWRLGGAPLSDGGNISGSQTGTLIVSPAHAADQGTYDCVVTNACGTVTSTGADLTVNTGSNCGSADFNGDGDLGTDADIEAFFACLSGDCCPTCDPHGADFNGDGDLGTDADIEAFFRVLAGGPC